MLFWGIIIVLFAAFLAEEFFFLRKLKQAYYEREKKLSEKHYFLEKEDENLKGKVSSLEKTLTERFLFYDITRRIAPLLDKKNLFKTFCEEIKYLGPIEEIEFCESLEGGDYLKFELGEKKDEALCIRTKAKAVIRYIPYFVKLLRLCLERIRLYDELQQLSIYDPLTKTYNRRYFMLRFLEEFERAKKFNLNLGFLMIDIDHFKRINDTFGHLVGDSVLKEIARLIRENIREIDFLARFGGEEFSVILPETDKSGVIMVGERIRSKISREKIKVFDETLSLSVSVGVSAFPQSTLYSDVLIEVADKALYKAKLSGRNRVGWF